MSLERIKYGVEYDPERNREGDSSHVKWIVAAALAAAAVSALWRLLHKPQDRGDGGFPPDPPVLAPENGAPAPASAAPSAPPPRADSLPSPIDLSGIGTRPPKVRSLMMRLDKAAKDGDIEMQVSTIESIMSLPGNAAADIADGLVPRLGKLNRELLFTRHSARWVSEIPVKPGDTASRIAREHGSTLASLLKLNSIEDAGKITAGRKIKVMNHPRFNMTVHKKLRSVDLFLNGRLFARYELPDGAPAVSGETGDYKTPAKASDLLSRLGVELSAGDMEEITILAPADTPVVVTAS